MRGPVPSLCQGSVDRPWLASDPSITKVRQPELPLCSVRQEVPGLSIVEQLRNRSDKLTVQHAGAEFPAERDISEHELQRNGAGAIAIDGPAAAGKTVVGTRLARKMGYRFLDTGMMYRAATVAALDAGADFDSTDELTRVAEAMDIEARAAADGTTQIVVDGIDITSRLRSHEVDSRVSIVSAIPRVREIMVAAQRKLASHGEIVMVGRDIGTVVLTDADPKIFLTATIETRAKRRYEEMKDRPGQPPLEEVLATMRRRDEIDSSREASPLRPASDAVIVETDEMTVEEVVCKLHDIARGNAS